MQPAAQEREQEDAQAALRQGPRPPPRTAHRDHSGRQEGEEGNREGEEGNREGGEEVPREEVRDELGSRDFRRVSCDGDSAARLLGVEKTT